MMNAIQVTDNSDICLIKTNSPHANDQEVIIQTLGCGVCGTDLLKINLKLLKQSTVLGHEIVGRITEAGSQVKDFKKGDLVVVAHHVPCFECHYCEHQSYSMCETFKKTNLDPGGFAEYVRLSADHLKHTTFKIPDHMPWQEAIFTEPLACCVRNIDRLPIRKKDTVIVVGLGSIGLMMCRLLKRLDCHVIGLDLDPTRRENAQKYGSPETFETLPIEHLKKITEDRGADGVIFTAGPAELLNTSLNWVRNSGFINLFAHLSGETTQLDTAALYHRELQIITTYSASPESLRKSFDILSQENLNLHQMFEYYDPQNFQRAIDDVNKRQVLKALIQFNSE